ncbi:uncharacterized protein LOC130674563 [Microplitis mediator]|uniref:uncharacterized protein LOC130674563 n=1 Tax=Microplitis mediator TaxID=375433 RepID=UPI002555BEF5|nr:uncharacterized protein LOC130674563 [Microplitis mediator]
MYSVINYKKFFMIIISIESFVLNVNGLECYECAKIATSHVYCIQIHDNFIKTCPKKYCTIYRKELLDIYEGNNELQDLIRSCSDSKNFPESINLTESNIRSLNINSLRSDSVVITTGNYKHYYQTCDRDLCNRGNGIDGDDNDLVSSVIIVPGIGTNLSALMTSSNYFSYLVYLIIIYLFM